MTEIRERLTGNLRREWTGAAFDVGLDKIIVLTPCCYQRCNLGAYNWHTGLAVMCEACGTPYDVIFKGHLGHSGNAGWAIQ